MREFWVYILECADGSFYTGHTDNLESRLSQHSQGLMCEWTRKRRPVRLAWCETVPSREEALANEQRIKGWSRAKKMALIARDWEALNHWAKKPRERVGMRPSFSLGTNGSGDPQAQQLQPATFVPSGNEGR